jgi:hypothetical protein
MLTWQKQSTVEVRTMKPLEKSVSSLPRISVRSTVQLFETCICDSPRDHGIAVPMQTTVDEASMPRHAGRLIVTRHDQ